MSLTIDISAAVNVPAGLGRYARSLVEAMLPYQEPQVFYNIIPGRTQPVEAFKFLPTYTLKMGYKPWRMAVWAGQIMRLPFNRLVPNTTLFHATEHLLMPLRGVKTVITVHDLIFKLFPEHHKRLNYWFLNSAMPLFVKRADHVIAISEATKRDLMTHYNTPSEKITVIYEAASPHFKPQAPEKIAGVRRRYHLPETYLVVVGTIEPRKNYSRLLQAVQQLRRDYPDLYLVVVGSKGWLYEDFFQQIEALNAKDWIIFPGYVPDADLPAVYAGATVMAMASVYEGFGLPLLEALSCGVPAVSSHASCMPEVGGDAVLYFDLVNGVLGIRAFDPFPFILLNLTLSTLAALQAPVILMSQNRQGEKDRAIAQNDYQVNLKNELEIADLHRKLDDLSAALLTQTRLVNALVIARRHELSATVRAIEKTRRDESA